MAVYHAEHAPLELADGTPLYIEWIIEGDGGDLYRVPAEPGGWFRRSPYRGRRETLEQVPERQAEAILWLTYAAADARIVEDHAFEHHDL